MGTLKFKNKQILTLIFSFLSSASGSASGYLESEKIKELNFYCTSNNLISFHCGKLDSQNKVGIIKLPVLKSVTTRDGSHAFRIMPSFTNLTGTTLTGVQFEFMFQDAEETKYQLNYSGTVKNKMTTSIEKSFLIRSDIPIYSDFYIALRKAYYSRQMDKINIGINQIKTSN